MATERPLAHAPLDSDDVMDLSADETKALARRLVANHLYYGRWRLSWEDLPMLSEAAFARLVEVVDVIAGEAVDAADAFDRAENIDSRLLLERASNA